MVVVAWWILDRKLCQGRRVSGIARQLAGSWVILCSSDGVNGSRSRRLGIDDKSSKKKTSSETQCQGKRRGRRVIEINGRTEEIRETNKDLCSWMIDRKRRSKKNWLDTPDKGRQHFKRE